MSKVHWTGHPFVDAGLSALAAVARVQQLGHLMAKHLDEAVKQLKRILLSDQALGLGVKRAFARTAMSYLFPNSELVNPMHWRSDKTPLQNANNVRQKFSKALEEDLKRAKRCLQSDGGDAICYACGERRPAEAMVTMRKDKMPLLEGIVNFYPALAFGVQICGLCALAVRFLPLSVMRTGTKNRMWFLHAQSLPITATIARTYGWEHFNRLIAKDEPLDFFSSWETAGDAGMVLYLLCELLERYGDVLIETYQNPLPTTAYLFSNSNRGGFIQPLPIPNELLLFLAKLQLQSQRAFRRFWRELLQIPASLSKGEREARIKFVQPTANCLLNVQSIIAKCLDHNTPKLRGGWRGHRLYLKEVMKMPTTKLAILERLGIQIAQSDDAKKRIMELRNAEHGAVYGALLRYVREGWLKHDEFYALVPPNDYVTANEVRDILLAVIYEWQYCQQRNEEFPTVEEIATISPDETLKRIQQIGERLITELPNLKRWIGSLQTANSTSQMRRTYLMAVQRGAMGFDDFIFVAPMDDRGRIRLLRDYLLAFLFDRAREIAPQQEIAVGAEIASSEDETIDGGEE